MEMVVTLLIVAVVLPLTLGLVRNLMQQSQNVHDTIVGVQQSQTAGEALLKYLHGTEVILPGSNATTLNASILAGADSTSTPYTATLTATLTNSTGPNLDATFTTSLTPNGGTTLSVGTYDAVNSSQVFTYYYVNPTTGSSTTTTSASTTTTTVATSTACGSSSTTTSTTSTTSPVSTTTTTLPNGLSSTSAPTNVQLSEIVAVGINVTFLAGPHVPTEGFQAVHPTTFATTIYLQNATGGPTPSTALSLANSTSSPAVGSPLTITATVAPVPDAGTVSFCVTQGVSPGTVLTTACAAPVSVALTGANAGTATCTFNPPSGGSYGINAVYSGSANYQPSTTGTLVVAVPIPTTLTLTAAAGSSKQLNLTATVSPAPPLGDPTASVTYTVDAIGSQSCNGSKITSGSLSASGTAGQWTATVGGLTSGTTYCVSASFSDASGTYSSSTGTANGKAG